MYHWGAKEVLTEETLAQNLRKLHDERGIFDRLRTHFRKLILGELLSGPGALAPTAISIRSRAIGSLFVEWLLCHNCHYTLCMLTSEIPSLTDLPDLIVKDPGKRRKPDDVKEILDVLQVYDRETGELYQKSNDTLISCIFKVAEAWKGRLKFRDDCICAGDCGETSPKWAGQLREILSSVGIDADLLPQLQATLSRLFTTLIQDKLKEEREAFDGDLINRERKFQSLIKSQEAKVNSKLKDIEAALNQAKGRGGINLTVRKDLLIKLLADVKEQHKSVVDGLTALEEEEIVLKRDRKAWEVKIIEENERLQALAQNLEKKSVELVEEKNRLQGNSQKFKSVESCKKLEDVELERDRKTWETKILEENKRLEELAQKLEKKSIELAEERNRLRENMERVESVRSFKKGPPTDTELSPKTLGTLKAARKGELEPTGKFQKTSHVLHTQSLDAIATYAPLTQPSCLGETQRTQTPIGSGIRGLFDSLEKIPRTSCTPEIKPLNNSLTPREQTSRSLGDSPQQVQQAPSRQGPLYPHPIMHPPSQNTHFPRAQILGIQPSCSHQTPCCHSSVLKPIPDTSSLEPGKYGVCNNSALQASSIPVFTNKQNSFIKTPRSERSRSPILSTTTSSFSEAVDGRAYNRRLTELRQEGRRAKEEFEAYRKHVEDETSDSCDEKTPEKVISYLQRLRTRTYSDHTASKVVSFPNRHEGVHSGPELHLRTPRSQGSSEIFGQGDVPRLALARQAQTETPRLSFLDKIVNRAEESLPASKSSHSLQNIQRILEYVRTSDAPVSQKTHDSSGELRLLEAVSIADIEENTKEEQRLLDSVRTAEKTITRIKDKADGEQRLLETTHTDAQIKEIEKEEPSFLESISVILEGCTERRNSSKGESSSEKSYSNLPVKAKSRTSIAGIIEREKNGKAKARPTGDTKSNKISSKVNTKSSPRRTNKQSESQAQPEGVIQDAQSINSLLQQIVLADDSEISEGQVVSAGKRSTSSANDVWKY